MRALKKLWIPSLFVLFTCAVAVAQTSYVPDVPEPGSVEAIARDTTEPRFMSPWVSYVPDSSTVPSPTEFFGHIAGAAGELLHTQRRHLSSVRLAASSHLFARML